MLDGPKKVGTGEVLEGVTVPTFSATRAPVLELADRRGLQPRAHSGRPGPIPGWGTTTNPSWKFDSILLCQKSRRENAKVNGVRVKNALS